MEDLKDKTKAVSFGDYGQQTTDYGQGGSRNYGTAELRNYGITEATPRQRVVRQPLVDL